MESCEIVGLCSFITVLSRRLATSCTHPLLSIIQALLLSSALGSERCWSAPQYYLQNSQLAAAAVYMIIVFPQSQVRALRSTYYQSNKALDTYCCKYCSSVWHTLLVLLSWRLWYTIFLWFSLFYYLTDALCLVPGENETFVEHYRAQEKKAENRRDLRNKFVRCPTFLCQSFYLLCPPSLAVLVLPFFYRGYFSFLSWGSDCVVLFSQVMASG